MRRKHFISVLGTSLYEPISYVESKKLNSEHLGEIDKEKFEFVQIAILNKCVLQGKDKLGDDDKVTILVTESSKHKNYVTRKCEGGELKAAQIKNIMLKETAGGVLKVGLEEQLLNDGVSEKQLESVTIPLGENEEELMEIFKKIQETIEEDEDVYVDVTHGLRNLPIQMLAALCFSRVTRNNIRIAGIYYGAYEARYNNDGADVAPIFDLLPFLDIIEWSFAANSFLKFGNSDEIWDLSNEHFTALRNTYHRDSKDSISKYVSNIARSLNSLTRNLETSRGYYPAEQIGKKGKKKFDYNNSIAGACIDFKERIAEYNDCLDNHKYSDFSEDESLVPIRSLMDDIENKVDKIKFGTNLETGLSAVDWAIKHHKVQQGYTALEETCKTFLCEYYGLDEADKIDRESICKNICNRCALQLRDNTEIDRDKIKKDFEEDYKEQIRETRETRENGETEHIEKNIDKINYIIDTIPKEFVELTRKISESRNNINHFGYSNTGSGNLTSDTLEKNLKEYNKSLLDLIDEMNGRHTQNPE